MINFGLWKCTGKIYEFAVFFNPRQRYCHNRIVENKHIYLQYEPILVKFF